MSILIVDDEQDVLNSLKEVLSMAGYSVLTASCGEEAIDCLDNEEVSMMLVDMSMPGMSGEDLLMFLEREKRRPPALMITAMAPWRLLKLMEYGIGYLRKPVNNDMLLGAIQSLLRKERHSEVKGSC